jgi:hypothetical protein
MSREERIISKLEGACSLIEFLNLEYPDVLNKWKNKSAGLAAHTQQSTDAATLVINQNDFRDK